MKKNLIRRSSIVAVLISLLMVTLTACGSEATVEEAKDSEVVIAEEAVIEEEAAAEVAEPEPTPEAVPEPTVEPTPETTEENTPESIVYEGIDMESTLSSGEWVSTFLGIIEEPKFVVTNSATNKKVIVEDGQEVVLESGDVLGVYLPGGILGGYTGVNVTGTENYGNYYVEFKIGVITQKSTLEVKIATDEGLKTINCTLVPN